MIRPLMVQNKLSLVVLIMHGNSNKYVLSLLANVCKETDNLDPMTRQGMYASPAWWGFLKADERKRLQSIINKAERYGYLPRSFCTLDQLIQDSDEKLFFLSRYNPNHVLHFLLPQPKNTSYYLRQRSHNLTLPADINVVIKQNFIYRMLFTDIY